MRIPTSAALLVEHPVLCAPKVEGQASESEPESAIALSSSLSRRDRFRAAVQLTAAAALLAEFDLWLPGSALRRVRFLRTEAGLRAATTGFPEGLSATLERLGGGERAVDAARESVLQRIADAVGLEATAIDVGGVEPGFFLEGAVNRQLRELPLPLDPATARSLWAFRWDPLPEPEAGTVCYWRVESPTLARRLGGALWCDLERKQQDAWLWPAGQHTLDTAPVPALERGGVLILVGDVSHAELGALSRWAQRDGCSAVAVGTFPGEWRPPSPPGFNKDHLARHLAVVGLSLDQARKFVERRQGTFNPLSQADRSSVTVRARSVFSEPQSVVGTANETQKNEVGEWLALCPTGLPPGFLEVQTGLTPHDLEVDGNAAGVVSRGDCWRLPDPVLLRPDTRHTAIAGLFEMDDPLHLLHAALGSNDPNPLAEWARQGVDALEDSLVRMVLSQLEAGVFGHDVQLLLAEACLSMKDLVGARAALEPVPPGEAHALYQWLESLDQTPGAQRGLPVEIENPCSARANAEIAILSLRESRRNLTVRSEQALASLRQLLPLLRGASGKRIEIELASVEEPHRLEDREWRRRMAGNHPRLWMLLAYRRGLQLLSQKSTRGARRMLQRSAGLAQGPGEIGSIEFNLGSVALDEGRSGDADRHQLQAYRLLRSAGFENRTRAVLFNLAVADVDQLRVAKAGARFSQLGGENPDDPFVIGELARLSLARGVEENFLEQLTRFEKAVDDDDPRFSQGLHLLRGVAALLDGGLESSIEHLRSAGQEGEAWLDLAAAVTGQEVARPSSDAWGISRAAAIVRAMKSDRHPVERVIENGTWKTSEAVAMAVAERLTGVRLPLEMNLRLKAIRELRNSNLDGWADRLADGSIRSDAAIAALAKIVEGCDIRDLEEDHTRELLKGLGVEGLEIRHPVDGAGDWRIGEGRRGAELFHGGVLIVPLGGEVDDSPMWRLFLGVVGGLVVPSLPWPDHDMDETGFLGVSDAARVVRRELREMAPSHLPVLIHGETGVGKEVAARALHRLSSRSGQFVAVNVAAIPGGLLEAELFGSVKGAFTGADRSRQGLVVAADGGTLLLDEVGDLDPMLQVKLLRFLESQEVRPVGSNTARRVDVRVLSATHRNLARRMREGRFRSDLYYRLAAPELPIPPLRERRQDITVLKEAFESEACLRRGLKRCRWSHETLTALERHDWPGNARELRQVIEVAMVRASGATIRMEHLPFSTPDRTISGTWADAQREFRRRFLVEALHRNGGNRSATARELGISRQALLYHLKNLGLSKPSKT